MDWLGRIRRWGRPPGPAGVDLTTLAPAEPFTVIGDVHGRLDLLQPLLASLPPGRVVLVGDYIDRGPDSAGVLELLQARSRTGSTICLAGNHEAMLLGFVDDPARWGPTWLTNGGMETLWSLGLQPGRGEADAALADLARRLAVRLGPVLPWLRGLPLCWQSGNVAVVHAGTDPALPLAGQPAKVLQWTRPVAGQPPRPDGIWILHGHTVVPAVEITPGRVNCDTGAFASGRLSAVRVERGRLQVLP